LLWSLKQWGGSFGFGFGEHALLSFIALSVHRVLTSAQAEWRFSWRVIQAEVLSSKSEVLSPKPEVEVA
jgi:uncharacterized membrane protein